MRAAHLSILLVLFMGTACVTYEEETRIDAALTQAINHFHEELNNEQFHEIYMEADPSLRQTIDEPGFTNQLRDAHNQLGNVAAETHVLLSTRALNDLHWARLLRRPQLVTHAELPNSNLINASERFQWRIEDNQPKLTSYDFRFICRKPCSIGIGR